MVGARPRTLGWAGVVVLGMAAASCARTGGGVTQAAPGQVANAAQSVAPGLSVSCAPGQRTLVRQIVVNGQPATDVQCVVEQGAWPAMPGTSGAGAPVAATPGWAPATAYAQQPAATAGYVAPPAVGDTWVPVAPARPRGRTVAYRTDGDVLTYALRTTRRVRAGRSWQKSAVIIGSSAGLGAGVGAAIGGKKGALIGAAIGGGSSAIWDQATRRR